MIKEFMRKTMAVLVSITMVLIVLPTIPVHATQTRKNNFSTSYTLTGNGAQDIINVAMAQIGKTGSDLGYSEEWCADFVSDCADLAGQGSAVPRTGAVSHEYSESAPWWGLRQTIIQAGGRDVGLDNAQPGDIVFFSGHVEIVYSGTGVNLKSIGENTGNGGSCYSRVVCSPRTHGSPITVLRPNYTGTQVITAPIVSTNKESYVPGADIDINWNYVTGATGYWIDLYQDGEHILSSNIGNVNKYTLKKAANAEYGVFITAFKDDGNWQSACSECCHFSVRDVNAPVVYTNHEYFAPDAEVDIMWDLVDGATGYWIDIYQDGEHIVSKSLNDANCSKYTHQCSTGKYGVFVTAYSENGGWSSACSNCHNFYVQDVEAPKPTANSNCYTLGSNVEITWDKVDSASGYWIDVYHDGEHIITENIGDVLSYTIKNVELGKYGIFVTAYNGWGGWTGAHDEAISFLVKERPSKPSLDVTVNGTSVSLEWNECSNTDYYGVRINTSNDGISYLYTEPYEGNDFITSLPPGKYFANIASVQKNGFYTFSDDIYFEIEESNVEGDCNGDGAFNVSDVVLLQKWLLAIPDTHFANWKAADMCEDNRLDVFDLCLMKRKLINSKSLE